MPPSSDTNTHLMRELAHALEGTSQALRRLSGIPENDREYLTSQEVADRLKVHHQYVDRLVKMGLKHYRIGRGPKFLWTEVQQFVENKYGAVDEFARRVA
jgi:excisionase family DNA binding protein